MMTARTDGAREDGVWVTTKAKCPECGRVFDLADTNDAAEWYYGHDCEVVE